MADATSFTIDSVYPWGRSLDEYRRMFALTDEDLNGCIAGCADGPASFNAEMLQRGGRVVSFDPLYQFTTAEIRRRIDLTFPQLIEWARQNMHLFALDKIHSSADLYQQRLATMDRFLADYDAGKAAGRYVVAALPKLPAADRHFDLALCSHFLFLYSEQFTLEFHLDAITEMLRIASEVRVFPLLDFGGQRSCHVEPVLDLLAQRGLQTSIEQVPYEVQRGGNQMLRIRAIQVCV